MRLYKYMSEEAALRFARSQQIRFSPPLSFNDPFEMRPAFTSRELQDLVNNTTGELGVGCAEHNYISDRLYLTMLRSVASKVGMICLSETPNNILMWAHYAENHRGAVVEFDASHEFFTSSNFNDKPQFFRKVLYSNNRVSLGWDYMRKFPSSDCDGRGYAHLFEEQHPIFFTKSIDWEYEKEWRVVRQNLPPGEESTHDFRESIISGRYRDTVYKSQLCEVPSQAISAVIFGAVCRKPNNYGEINGLEEDISEIMDNNANLSHVRFYKARLNNENNSIQLFDLESESDIRNNVPLEWAPRMGGFRGRRPTKP